MLGTRTKPSAAKRVAKAVYFPVQITLGVAAVLLLSAGGALFMLNTVVTQKLDDK